MHIMCVIKLLYILVTKFVSLTYMLSPERTFVIVEEGAAYERMRQECTALQSASSCQVESPYSDQTEIFMTS